MGQLAANMHSGAARLVDAAAAGGAVAPESAVGMAMLRTNKMATP